MDLLRDARWSLKKGPHIGFMLSSYGDSHVDLSLVHGCLQVSELFLSCKDKLHEDDRR